MKKSTVMPRKMRCITCGYTQEDYTSYYKHKKTWVRNHDLNGCLEIRRNNDELASMFTESLDSLSKLTLIK
jgi:hypothetical protein